MIFTASAVGVSLLARANGGFEVGAWAPAGAVLVLLVAALLALGFRPGTWVTVGAAALVALGLWALLSTSWGGIPDEAWRQVDKSLIAAAALVLGPSSPRQAGRECWRSVCSPGSCQRG